ncbi:hypothetical protein DPMN_184211 [Dreissena polymorpha]|uniref:Uncharacterized protein n=1 Tax=Dreissena polymorpha TaxID=45954 RepID=A0A9D4DJX8_DREPO|nr:hypothetical protein DPMN_184103 [Dreissena polymorpha]KAH3749654.1 hypothetical protein DPMN_184155 [Dreissena polymorpha]KAH3749705.1 hypothetical protein DPMN_184211 [Dreissena polymorpha]
MLTYHRDLQQNVDLLTYHRDLQQNVDLLILSAGAPELLSLARIGGRVKHNHCIVGGKCEIRV